MARYRKKPADVEVLQYDGENAEDVVTWIEGARAGFVSAALSGPVLHIDGGLTVNSGDYIVRDVHGDHRAYSPEDFHSKYEPSPELVLDRRSRR